MENKREKNLRFESMKVGRSKASLPRCLDMGAVPVEVTATAREHCLMTIQDDDSWEVLSDALPFLPLNGLPERPAV